MLSELLRFLEVLFIIDDIIANKELEKRRQPLLELSGRHRGHSLWFLTQSYTTTPKSLRKQAKAIFVWYPRNDGSQNIREENDVLTDDELVVARGLLRESKYGCLHIRNNILVDLGC